MNTLKFKLHGFAKFKNLSELDEFIIKNPYKRVIKNFKENSIGKEISDALVSLPKVPEDIPMEVLNSSKIRSFRNITPIPKKSAIYDVIDRYDKNYEFLENETYDVYKKYGMKYVSGDESVLLLIDQSYDENCLVDLNILTVTQATEEGFIG